MVLWMFYENYIYSAESGLLGEYLKKISIHWLILSLQSDNAIRVCFNINWYINEDSSPFSASTPLPMHWVTSCSLPEALILQGCSIQRYATRCCVQVDSVAAELRSSAAELLSTSYWAPLQLGLILPRIHFRLGISCCRLVNLLYRTGLTESGHKQSR